MKKLIMYLSADFFDFKINERTDYQQILNSYKQGIGGNVGNKFFLSATYRYLQEDIDWNHTIYYSDKRKDYFITNDTIEGINSDFRAIVLPQANIFSEDQSALTQMEGFTSIIKKIRIPVFVTGVGAQATRYDDIYNLYTTINPIASEFCKSVYNTGGEFSLRGYFTKELFDMMGYKTAVVTGCPSIFQVGRNFKINNSKVSREDFRPIINGTSSIFRDKVIYDSFGKFKAVYFDQDEFLRILYDEELLLDNNMIQTLIYNYGIRALELLKTDSIKLFYDIPSWCHFIQENRFNFSFGKRIHGNIISIINGIPAKVWIHDTRTKEMAEYFDIPVTTKISNYSDLYEIYLSTDYRKFNSTFKDKFDRFDKFLLEHNLRSTSLTEQENFLDKNTDFEFPTSVNITKIQDNWELIEKLKYKESFWKVHKCILDKMFIAKRMLLANWRKHNYLNERKKY